MYSKFDVFYSPQNYNLYLISSIEFPMSKSFQFEGSTCHAEGSHFQFVQAPEKNGSDWVMTKLLNQYAIAVSGLIMNLLLTVSTERKYQVRTSLFGTLRDPKSYYQSFDSAIGFRKVPIPTAVISISSPTFRNLFSKKPTPAGDPVKMISPGNRLK